MLGTEQRGPQAWTLKSELRGAHFNGCDAARQSNGKQRQALARRCCGLGADADWLETQGHFRLDAFPKLLPCA